MEWSIKIGTVKGTAIKLHFTFLLFLAWFGIGFYLQGGGAAAIGGITFLLLLFLCVVLHEFGHILAARRFGIRTPDVVLLPIGGISRLERIPEKPREELLIALAGPAVTLAIALVLILLLGRLPDPSAVMGQATGESLLAQLAFANIVLLAFNLVPAFPLDGGRVLRALLAARIGHLRGTQVAAAIGRTAAIVIGLIALLNGHVLLVLIAFFIYVAAGAEAGLAQMRGITSGVPARDAMVTRFERLNESTSVAEAADALIRTSQREFPVVDAAGRMIGVVTRDGIVAALADRPDSTRVSETMKTGIPSLSQWQRLDDSVVLLEQGAPAVGVTDADGRLIGLITWENLVERLMIAQATLRRRAATGTAAPAR